MARSSYIYIITVNAPYFGTPSAFTVKREAEAAFFRIAEARTWGYPRDYEPPLSVLRVRDGLPGALNEPKVMTDEFMQHWKEHRP